jgi:hypothetical protein
VNLVGECNYGYDPIHGLHTFSVTVAGTLFTGSGSAPSEALANLSSGLKGAGW